MSTAAASPAAAKIADGLGDIVTDVLRAKRAEIVGYVNTSVDIPLITEPTEQKLFEAVFDVLLEAVDAVV